MVLNLLGKRNSPLTQMMKFSQFSQWATLSAVVGGLLLGRLGAVPVTSLPDVSLLTPYATFGHSYNDHNVTVQGNAGISNNGSLALEAPSSITGNLYLGTGASVSGPGHVLGTTFSGLNLLAAQAQVQSASSALASLTPVDVSLGAVTVPAGGVTWGTANGVVDVNVFNVASITTGGGSISFAGDPGDYYVLNIAGGLTMSGSAAIGSAALASHTFVNLYDDSGTDLGLIAMVGNVINGTLLIPYDSATLHSVSGAIWSGAPTIKLMSGARIISVPFEPPPPTVPDTAPTWILLGVAVTALATTRKFVLRQGRRAERR